MARTAMPEQVREEWLDGDVKLITRMGRTEHPDWASTPITWFVSLRDVRADERLAMETGWAPRIVDATVVVADARVELIGRYRSGEWKGDGDGPF